MTKQELRQLKDLNKEIELIQKEIESIEPQKVADTVVGSSKHAPYTAHVIRIEGVNVSEYERQLWRLKRRLERRLQDVMDKREEIEVFIDTINDSLLRQIIALRYINNLSWTQIACHIGGGNTANGIRMQHDRFLKRME